MDERDWTDRFSCDVDRLVKGVDPMDSEQLPTEYRQTLDLARALTKIDFSVESRVRQILRRQLLSQIDVQGGWRRRKGHPMHASWWRRHVVAPLAIIVLTTLLVNILIFAIPSVQAVAREALERIPLWIPCVVRTEGGYVILMGTKGPLGLMKWEPVTPPLPANPLFHIMAVPGICPEVPGFILWGYARPELFLSGLAGLVVCIAFLAYPRTRAKIINTIGVVGSWIRESVWARPWR